MKGRQWNYNSIRSIFKLINPLVDGLGVISQKPSGKMLSHTD